MAEHSEVTMVGTMETSLVEYWVAQMVPWKAATTAAP